MTDATLSHHEFSVRSVLLIVVFIVALVASVCSAVSGLLQYSGLVGALPAAGLELAAAITGATVFPMLAMGMSISADLNRNKQPMS